MSRKKKIPERLRKAISVKRTFTLTQSIQERLERFPEVNWSAVVREKLDEFLKELES